MRDISDYPENTRLKVRLVRYDENGWTPRQARWLQKRVGQELFGTVEMVQGSLYFRPDRCNILVLRDHEIEVLSVLRE